MTFGVDSDHPSALSKYVSCSGSSNATNAGPGITKSASLPRPISVELLGLSNAKQKKLPLRQPSRHLRRKLSSDNSKVSGRTAKPCVRIPAPPFVMSVTLTSTERTPVFPPKNSDAALAILALPSDLRSFIVVSRSLNEFLAIGLAARRPPLICCPI